MMEIQIIRIPEIVLEWSDWQAWESIKIDARKPDGVFIPKRSGVYEAKHAQTNEIYTIGKTGNLRHRVRSSLVKGQYPHSTGERIRSSEDTSHIMVRWAVTDRPAAAEEALLIMYQQKHGRLPKHTISVR